MSLYLSAKRDKASRSPLLLKSMGAIVFSTFVLMLVEEGGGTPSPRYSSFAPPATSEQPAIAGLKDNTPGLIGRMKADYPSSFRRDKNGAAHITIAPQSFYTCTRDGDQEIVTAKSRTMKRIVFQLNQKHISYNIKEGLGTWTIQWNEEIFLPVL